MKTLRASLLLSTIAGLPTVAAADDLGAAHGVLIAAAAEDDLAEIFDDGKLRKQDEEFTNEQAAVKFSPDGRRALYVHMRTSKLYNPTLGALEDPPGDSVYPEHRMQCALTVLETKLVDGKLTVERPASAPYDRFVTANRGNEYRNCNKPEFRLINGGALVALEYNYQPQGQGDTKRYMKVFDWDGNEIQVTGPGLDGDRNQVVVMAKNNDDCSMHQSGAGQGGIPYYDQGGVTRLVGWDGCNGNGADDGWIRATQVTCTGTGAAATCEIEKLFDLSLAQREERSRGRCTVGGADLSFAMCTWTEGNTQPQREGTWIAAVDLAEGTDDRLLWKERLNYIQTLDVNGEEREYYAMRAQHGRVMAVDASGNLAPTDDLIFQDTGNRGGNNNNKKGGRSDIMNMAVIKASRDGLVFTKEMTMFDMTSNDYFDGFDATHVSLGEAVFGKGNQLVPGFTLLQGIHTAAARPAEIKAFGFDGTTFVDYGKHLAGASYDRHLYSNYLGNNPGNQGRNFAGSDLVKNPFVGAGSKVTYFQAHALTGKAESDMTIKPSAFLSILPVAFTEDAPLPGGGFPDDGGTGGGGGDLGGTSAELTGGCNAAGAGAGLLPLVLGFGLTVRRRRRRA